MKYIVDVYGGGQAWTHGVFDTYKSALGSARDRARVNKDDGMFISYRPSTRTFRLGSKDWHPSIQPEDVVHPAGLVG